MGDERGRGWKIGNRTLKNARSSPNDSAEGTWRRLARLRKREAVNGVPAIASPVYRERLWRLQGRALSMKQAA